jgi:hypothetical protein
MKRVLFCTKRDLTLNRLIAINLNTNSQKSEPTYFFALSPISARELIHSQYQQTSRFPHGRSKTTQ